LSTGQTILLGAIAGSTIFVGLPLGRLRSPHPRLKAFLNAISAGILLFLLFDILENATAPLERLVEEAGQGAPAWAHFSALAAVYAIGLAAGLLSLLYLNRWQRSRRSSPAIGPGAMAVAEAADIELRQSAMRLGMSIAAAIGLHNFSEGLAIGQAAKGGEVQLAVLLVVGFALHNGTEGFGIIGPLAAGDVRASWPYLLSAGLIAGGPTFVGTIVGTALSSQYLFVAFLTLAAGAIIYVVAEMLFTGRRLGAWDITIWGVLAGFLLGLATEMVIVAAGA
jgi:ZIP family zinc transporter